MKFSAATLPILALFAQQASAIALPLSDELSAELAARHHHQPGGRAPQNGGGNRFGNGGFGNGGFGNGGFGNGGFGNGGNKNGGGNGGGNGGKGGNAGSSSAAGTAKTTSAVVASSAVASSAAPAATSSVAANNNANAGGRGGGRGGNKGGNKGGNGGTVSTSSAAVIGTSSAATSTATVGNTGSTVNTGGGNGGNGGNGNIGTNSGLSQAQITALQTSLTLDPTQIQPGLANDGQDQPTAGQVPSLTSKNNFMNFCATQKGVPLTNGQQIKTGSCNPTVMGRIIQTDKLPSSKFTFPVNQQTIAANTDFTIKMAVSNLITGNFVNAQENYYAAPCQVDGSGTVIGHTHVVVEEMTSLTQTAPTNPLKFAFFKGVNGAAVGGVVTADVTGGLAKGIYRLGSINTCANHQPVLGAVAQHGIFDDVVYFTVN